MPFPAKHSNILSLPLPGSRSCDADSFVPLILHIIIVNEQQQCRSSV